MVTASDTHGNSATPLTVIITGASRGLGLALALRYLDDGAHVITITRAAVPALAQRAREAGSQLSSIHADLSTASGVECAGSAVKAALDAIAAASSRVILINNAGAVEPVDVAQALTDPEAITRAFGLNVSAPIALTAAVLSSLPEQGRDCRILNISSGAGRQPTAGWSVYCATKAALDMATRVLNVEQSSRGVRAVALAPGVVDTGMQNTLRSQSTDHFPAQARFAALHAEGKLSSADDVAARIHLYLNRDDFGATEIDDIRNYN